MLVGDPRQFIEPAARQNPQAMEMRFQPLKIVRLQIKPEQIAQAAIHGIEILARAIRRDMVGAALAILRLGLVERLMRGRRVHV